MSVGNVWGLKEILTQNPISPGESVKRIPISEEEHFTVFLLQAQPNQRPYLHIHENHDELVYIIEGEGQFVIGDATKKVKLGDLLFFPKGTVHGPNIPVRGVRLSIYIPYFDPQKPDRKEV